MVDADPHENDPFFKRILDAEWNACIGKQGHEENYLDGYIEAAIELADAIIEKKMHAKRDTLVLPILYNARHAVELALKFATDRFCRAGVIKGDVQRNHNIRAYWDRLRDGAIGDEQLSHTIIALKPYIDSLSRIDSDGQELRYHRNRNDDPSLSNYSLANLKLIQVSLRELEKLLSALKYRTLAFFDERATKAFTNRCSRTDLITIARLMPRRDAWATETFDIQKSIVKNRFGLGNTQFSIALNQIQQNREMRAILGMESPLLHLSDDDIFWTTEQWRRLHPVQRQDKGRIRIDFSDTKRLAEVNRRVILGHEVGESITQKLSAEAIADLEAIFYLERDGIYTEY